MKTILEIVVQPSISHVVIFVKISIKNIFKFRMTVVQWYETRDPRPKTGQETEVLWPTESARL